MTIARASSAAMISAGISVHPANRAAEVLLCPARISNLSLPAIDLPPLHAVCTVSFRPRTLPCAVLRPIPFDAATSFPLCWSCEAWSHAARRVRLNAKRTVWDLGEPQQASGNVQKNIPTHCLPLPYATLCCKYKILMKAVAECPKPAFLYPLFCA